MTEPDRQQRAAASLRTRLEALLDLLGVLAIACGVGALVGLLLWPLGLIAGGAVLLGASLLSGALRPTPRPNDDEGAQ